MSNSQPWLSILLPLFRVEQWLAECLDSILAQRELDGVEILMLDDASDDGSRVLAQTYVQTHPHRFRLICKDVNEGIAAARNHLLDEACGEYVWFVDPDDVMMPGAVASLRRSVERWQPDLVMCDFRLIRERFLPKHKRRGELHKRSFIGASHQLMADPSQLMYGLFEAGHLQPWCKIIKRAIWPTQLRFPLGRCFEDVYMMPRVMLLARTYVHIPEVWIGYRKREGSILASMSMKKVDDMSFALVDLGDQMHGLSSAARFSQAFFAAGLFISSCRYASQSGAPLGLYRERLWQSIDFTLMGLSLQYCRRGWFWRYLRLLGWLLRARMSRS